MKKTISYFFVKTISMLMTCFLLMSASFGQTNREVAKGERPPIDLEQVPANAYEPGKLMIKLNPGMAKSLPDNKIISNEKGGYVLTGVSALDTLNYKHGITRYKPALYDYYKTSSSAQQYRERHEAWGFHLWFGLELDSIADVKIAVADFLKLDEVEIAEPMYKIQHTATSFSDEKSKLEGPPDSNKSRWTPNDPMFEDQWHFHNTGQYEGSMGADISMPPAWDIEKGHSDVIVAVIDHGIKWDHPDLAGNMWQNSQGHYGYNFVNNTPVITGERHGTLVAGVVAAESNNSVGIAGIAGGSGSGDGVRMMSCQVFHSVNQHGFFIAPVFAADNGAAISQNSWGYTEPNVYEQAALDAIDYFNVYGGGEVMNGGITIFAAGNESSSDCYYPGCYSGAMAVAGTDYWDSKAWYSNYGVWIDISSPGGDLSWSVRGILSTDRYDDYRRDEGTSMACPQVSGVAALLISYAHRNGYVINNSEVWDLLVESTDDHYPQNPDYIGQLGSGRLNAHHALSALVDQLDGLIKPPASIAATTVDTDQIDVVWTKNPDNHDVILLWSPDNTFGELMDGTVYTAGQTIAGGGYVLYRGSNNDFEHTGLEAATTHYYRAYSYDAESNYSSGRGTSATTFCSTVTTLPLIENFNALPKKPVCWKVIDHIGNGQVWHFDYIYRYDLHNPILDKFYAYVDSKMYGIDGEQNTDLITPLIDFSDYTDATVSFNHTFRRDLTFPSTGTFSFSIDDGDTWTHIQDWSDAHTDNPEEYSIVLQELGGQEQVRFKWNYEGSNGYYWAIDDIVISTLPPEISVVPSSLEFGFIASGDVSAAETYTVWGNKMESSPLTITAPQGFLVSPDGSDWSGTFDIVFTPPTLDATIVYVQFAPTGEPAEYSDDIANSGGGAAVKNVEVSGKSLLPPGTICDFAHEITELPFSQTGLTTEGSGNNYNMGNSNTCNTGFMEGEDYLFVFEPEEAIIVDISLTNTETYTGLFVFDGCPDDPETTCVAADYPFDGNPSLEAVVLAGGTSYYVVVSTAAINTPHTGFDILMVEWEAPPPTIPYIEDFESGGALPPGWSIEIIAGTANWSFQEGGHNDNPAFAYMGTYNAFLFSPDTEDDIALLISPVIDVTASPTPVMFFWHAQTAWMGQDELRVLYRTATDAPWTPIPSAVWTEEIPFWTQQRILLPNPSATYQIAFEGTARAGNGVCLDYVEIKGPNTISWGGMMGTGWHQNMNWNGNVIPGLTENAVIEENMMGNYPVISTTESCLNLTIDIGASVTISPSGELTVFADLAVIDEDGLVIQSDATGSGSLIHSTPGVSATVERHFASGETWRLVSSPVVGQEISGDWTPGGSYSGDHGYDFFAYDEETATWLNQKVPENDITHFIPGKGYLVSFETGPLTPEFTGNLNAGDQTIAVTRNSPGTYAGANLIGNPYASGIDWNLADRGLFEDDFAYVYDAAAHEGTGAYVEVNGVAADAFIAPHQGFFVLKQIGGSSDFTFTNAMRVHGGTFTKQQPMHETLVIRLSADTYYDQTTLRIHEYSGFERDRQDARKLFSYNQQAPQLYSYTSNNFQVSINSIPAINEDAVTRLGMRLPADGVYTLRLTEMSGTFGEQDIYLKDFGLGVEQNLSEVYGYDFSASAGDLENRFLIHFGDLSLDDSRAIPAANAYVLGNTLYILNARGQTRIEVLDLHGRLLISQRFSTEGLHSQPIALPVGLYVVRIMDAEGAKTIKIMVK